MYSILLWPIFLTLIHFNSMRVALQQQKNILKKMRGFIEELREDCFGLSLSGVLHCPAHARHRTVR